MEYFGILGRLVPLSCASSERVVSAARYVSQTTLEGRRRVQVAPASPRTWELSWGLADPQEMAALSGFTTGAWGPGPFHWVPIQAQKWNLLTPREAHFLDRTEGTNWVNAGPVEFDDGTAPTSMVSTMESGWNRIFRDLPCLPGVPVTWSADIAGDGTTIPELTLTFYDSAGNNLSGHDWLPAPSASGFHRVSYTSVPPPNAIKVEVGITYRTRQITRPQVTWTPGPVPYAAGYGCHAAVLDAPTEDLIAANRFGTWSTTSFTVMEVG